jgi:hypothetical protein
VKEVEGQTEGKGILVEMSRKKKREDGQVKRPQRATKRPKERMRNVHIV